MFPHPIYVLTTRLIVVLALSLSFAGLYGNAYAAGNVIYVRYDSNILGDGSTWDKAYVRLYDALAAATPGKQIWVTKGIYYPDQSYLDDSNSQSASFTLKN